MKLVIGMLAHKTMDRARYNFWRNPKGFTLIELLIVLLIIGVILSFGLLSFGDFGVKRRVIITSEQLINDIHTLQQQAILESSLLGINITNNGYDIMRFNFTDKIWEMNQTPGLAQHIFFPKQVIVHLKHLKDSPDITINTLGEVHSTKIDFGSQHQPIITTISSARCERQDVGKNSCLSIQEF